MADTPYGSPCPQPEDVSQRVEKLEEKVERLKRQHSEDFMQNSKVKDRLYGSLDFLQEQFIGFLEVRQLEKESEDKMLNVVKEVYDNMEKAAESEEKLQFFVSYARRIGLVLPKTFRKVPQVDIEEQKPTFFQKYLRIPATIALAGGILLGSYSGIRTVQKELFETQKITYKSAEGSYDR